jgi:hypothetical protein
MSNLSLPVFPQETIAIARFSPVFGEFFPKTSVKPILAAAAWL